VMRGPPSMAVLDTASASPTCAASACLPARCYRPCACSYGGAATAPVPALMGGAPPAPVPGAAASVGGGVCMWSRSCCTTAANQWTTDICRTAGGQEKREGRGGRWRR